MVNQYLIKYEKIINIGDLIPYEQASAEIDGELATEIMRLYADVIVGNPASREDKIIILDYLITLKQLLTIDSNKDLEYFHQKSQIEAIV